jgi:hypothetical protein
MLVAPVIDYGNCWRSFVAVDLRRIRGNLSTAIFCFGLANIAILPEINRPRHGTSRKPIGMCLHQIGDFFIPAFAGDERDSRV